MEKFTLLAGRAITNEVHKKVEEQVEEKKEADKKKKNKKKKWCFNSIIYPFIHLLSSSNWARFPAKGKGLPGICLLLIE